MFRLLNNPAYHVYSYGGWWRTCKSLLGACDFTEFGGRPTGQPTHLTPLKKQCTGGSSLLNTPASRVKHPYGGWLNTHEALVNRNYCTGGSGSSSLRRIMGTRHRKRPDAVESPRLTPKMVSSILQLNEKEVTVENRGPVNTYVVNELQANKPIEDRHMQGGLVHGKASLFGVIDGHAGCACAQTLSDSLFAYVAVAMADKPVLKSICDGELDPTTDLTTRLGESKWLKETDLAALQKQNLVNFAKERLANHRPGHRSAKEALVSAFLRLDKDITNEAIPANWEKSGMNMSLYMDLISIAFSGAVACLAYIDSTDLFVAGVGDSHAVLGVHNNNRWEAKPLTNAHVADNPSEIERITKNHPNEASSVIRNGRLFGRLVPLRAFGNARFKWTEAELRDLMNTSHISKVELMSSLGEDLVPQKYHTPPYLDAEPEVVQHKLRPTDKFLVLASDGLWDCLSPETVVELVGGHREGQRHLVNYSPPEGATLKEINSSLIMRSSSLENRALDSNAATHLLRSALGSDHGELSAQLTLPQPIVRGYRDDITIVIVYFDSQYIQLINVQQKKKPV